MGPSACLLPSDLYGDDADLLRHHVNVTELSHDLVELRSQAGDFLPLWSQRRAVLKTPSRMTRSELLVRRSH